MPERVLNIGIDATSWTNERGYGRFTREIVKALAARGGELRYTLLFDRIPDTPFPEGVLTSAAGTRRTLNESAVGSDSRSAGYLWRMGRAAARGLVRSHRLWESYVAKHFGLPADHLHLPAARVEHYISGPLREAIARDLHDTSRDPHGHPIPGPDASVVGDSTDNTEKRK